MRLEEGHSELEGRLEVCFSQRWGTVSNDGWTQTNTKVICNHLGYDTGTGNKHVRSDTLYEIACGIYQSF